MQTETHALSHACGCLCLAKTHVFVFIHAHIIRAHIRACLHACTHALLWILWLFMANKSKSNLCCIHYGSVRLGAPTYLWFCSRLSLQSIIVQRNRTRFSTCIRAHMNIHRHSFKGSSVGCWAGGGVTPYTHTSDSALDHRKVYLSTHECAHSGTMCLHITQMSNMGIFSCVNERRKMWCMYIRSVNTAENRPIFLATDLCRERITNCPADSRRTLSVLASEFPEVDFSHRYFFGIVCGRRERDACACTKLCACERAWMHMEMETTQRCRTDVLTVCSAFRRRAIHFGTRTRRIQSFARPAGTVPPPPFPLKIRTESRCAVPTKWCMLRLRFLKWLAKRPEARIAVVTHSGFLNRLFSQFGLGIDEVRLCLNFICMWLPYIHMWLLLFNLVGFAPLFFSCQSMTSRMCPWFNAWTKTW